MMKPKLLPYVFLVGASLCLPPLSYADHSQAELMASKDYVTPNQRAEDSRIIEIIMVVDKNEIAAADEAKKKATNPKVRHYANYLRHQHATNLKELAKLVQNTGLQPLNSSVSTSLAKDGLQGLTKLTGLNSKAFDTAYVDAMVQGHAAGLQLIDTNLLKHVTNARLKAFVQQTRAMVATHLKKARRLQKALSNES